MTPLPRTPQRYVRKPGSTAGTSRVRRDNPIPMTAMQLARWNANRNPPPRPLGAGDIIRATGEGAGGDEVDDGYLGAVRLAPRVVGTEARHVPLAVALRLVAAGLVEKV